MKSIVCAFIFLFFFNAIKAQLVRILENTENRASEMHYVDQNHNHYTGGRFAGVPVEVMFTRVNFNEQKNRFELEGITMTPVLSNDTVGFCCITIFLAETKGDSLYNIRVLGESNSIQEDSSKQNGFFSFETEVYPNDKLFFTAGFGGEGLIKYSIGKLIPYSKKVRRPAHYP